MLSARAGLAVPVVQIARDVARPDPVQPARSQTKLRRLLFLKRPTPCAGTYANNAGEESREMTLVGETTLRGHIEE